MSKLTRKELGDHYEQKAKSDLENRGYSVIDANALKRNNEAYDLIIEPSNGSKVMVSVKSCTTENWPIANGKATKNPDGSYNIEKIYKKLLVGGYTIIYHAHKKPDMVYVIPHDVIKALLQPWAEHRNGKEHTFTLNQKSASEIGLDMKLFERAWHLLPTQNRTQVFD